MSENNTNATNGLVNKGYLYKNKKKNKATQPDFTGKLNIKGEEVFISAWEKTNTSGEKFLSLSITSKEDMPQMSQQSTQNFSSPANITNNNQTKPKSTDQLADNSLSELNDLFDE